MRFVSALGRGVVGRGVHTFSFRRRRMPDDAARRCAGVAVRFGRRGGSLPAGEAAGRGNSPRSSEEPSGAC